MRGSEARLERLELKYLIDEPTAARIRRDLAPFCTIDPHHESVPGAPPGYRISSLYLDSPGLAFHQAKERGDPERLKLRVRTYHDPTVAVLEVKRRISDVIDKERVAIEAAEIERAIAWGTASGLSSPSLADPAAQRRLDRFARIHAEAGAQPTLHVRYRREAWASDVDDYARVTFDRAIEVKRAEGWTRAGSEAGWIAFDDTWAAEQRGRTVVLEIKCRPTVPWWIADLVRRHALKRTTFSKYSIGIYLTGRALGEPRLARRSARVMQ